VSVVVLGLLVGPPESVIATPEIHGPITCPEIVQFVVQITAVTLKVKDCVAFEPMPLLAVMVMGVTDGPVGVPLIVAVPSVLSTNVIGLGSVPEVTLNAGFGFPVVVTVKLPFTPCVNVTLLALVMTGAECTMICTVEVVFPPAAFVTVSV
jgi:hypothetical protein